MDQSTSYIADLPPENITYQLNSVETKLRKDPLQAPPYAPLDVHKNPYLSEGGTGPEYPQITSLKPQPQNPLPSRDIPQRGYDAMLDVEAQPNYVPVPKLTRDFVRENNELSEKKIAHRKRKKQRAKVWRLTWDELQIPLLLFVLYFLFQLPWLQSLMYKYVTFLPLFHSDGIINLYGMGFKAALFALAYYVMTKFTHVAALPPEDEEED